MKSLLKSYGLEMGVVALCAWQSSSLLTAWWHSPFDRLGWLSFIIWMLPAALRFAGHSAIRSGSPTITVLALLFVIAGRIFDLHIMMQAALALSLSAFVAPSGRRMVWVLAAIAWMPLLGWLARDLPVNAVAGLRLFIASAATAILISQPISKATTK